jgi:23S rRNA (adenine2503-C2)-methyltransferase
MNLLDFSLKQMKDLLIEMQEKSFHALQLFKWIHQHFEDDFEQMSNLPKSLRAKLAEQYHISAPKLVAEKIASDGTIKWLLAVDDINKIEAVFIPEENRYTLCISSQAGCALNCHFCSTAQQGFNRNLTVAEIIGQLFFANQRLKPKGITITNVVMMGMGEPLTNYKAVVHAMHTMLDDNAYGLSRRRVTLSTSGIVPRILELAVDCPVSLAVSLHASNDQVRSQIMPINDKHNIESLLKACNHYIPYSPRQFITFEYVMLKGINDTIEHAKELSNLLKDISCKINLIPFNPFPKTNFECSDNKQIQIFKDRLIKLSGKVVTVRKTRGEDVDAACGQLAGSILNKKVDYKIVHKIQPVKELNK